MGIRLKKMDIYADHDYNDNDADDDRSYESNAVELT